MERRFVLALCLMFLVWWGYQTYLVPPPPPPDAARQSSQTATPSPAVDAGTAAAPTPGPAPAPAAVEPEPAAVTAETNDREIAVDTGKVEVVLTNRGARVLHWRLDAYKDDKGNPLDLVPSGVPDQHPKPFSLAVPDARLTRRVNDVRYRVSSETPARVDASRTPATVVFEYEDAGGLRVRKEFTFIPGSYEVTFSATVTNGSERLKPSIQWGPGLGDLGAVTAGGSFFTGNYVQPPSAILDQAGDVTRIVAGKVSETPVHDGSFQYAGIDDHYFLAAAVDLGDARVEFRPVNLDGPGDLRRQLVAATITPADSSRPLRFFVGPKELETLRKVGVGGALANAINFGMFYWLVVPLLEALKWLYGFVGNYGWAIIILTILINVVMFPLRHKSLVSMRKTQALQPQIKSIQDRYAELKITDPARQKMNTEIMNLYREKGVNPAAGCVPMLLTMPVLLAFYSMLSQAIELRGADFGLWIHDLSMKDPYYVTPLLMGATMWWQMWMSPTTADPTQQRMMMFMPIVFTAMFLRFPSGLAIYYLVSNLCQIAQQYFTNRTIGPPVRVAARPAPERPAKVSGGGRRNES